MSQKKYPKAHIIFTCFWKLIYQGNNVLQSSPRGPKQKHDSVKLVGPTFVGCDLQQICAVRAAQNRTAGLKWEVIWKVLLCEGVFVCFVYSLGLAKTLGTKQVDNLYMFLKFYEGNSIYHHYPLLWCLARTQCILSFWFCCVVPAL